MSLSVQPTSFADAKLIVPPAHEDARGFFKETYVRSKYRSIGIDDDFVQDNVSFSHKNVLRGLHCDPAMSKLVQCLRGEVYDVIVDARPRSSSFGKWEGFHLSARSHMQLYVPAGFLHGFLALTDDVVFSYKQGSEYDPSREIGVRWDDADLRIDWRIASEPIVSRKDLSNARFVDVLRACGHLIFEEM